MIATPLFLLPTKNIEFVWTDECQSSFETLKQHLSEALILHGPNWSIPFQISTNT
jgi:hypothetical protein